MPRSEGSLMTNSIAILIDGAIYASWLFLVAAGLTIIYGVMRVLNMAHGSFYAIGAYSAASLIGWYFSGDQGEPYWSYLLLPACALVAGAWLMPARSDIPAKRPLLNELKILPTTSDGSSERSAVLSRFNGLFGQ